MKLVMLIYYPSFGEVRELPMTNKIISDFEKENNVTANPMYYIYDNNSILSFEPINDKDTIILLPPT